MKIVLIGSISYPSMRTTDAHKALHRHTDGGVDGDGEADLGEGQEDGDQVGEGVEGIKWRYLRQGEDKVGENDTAGVGDEEQAEKILEYWLQIQVFVLKDCQGYLSR